jgi:HAE1 family hydrophobic/amphiphilic exporter-1
MGQAVIGGIITSSILTLVVVPVIYTWLDDFAVWMRRRFGPPAPQSSGSGSAPLSGTAAKHDDPV